MGTSTLHLNNPVPSNGAVAASLGGRHTVTVTLAGVDAISCKVQAWASSNNTDSKMLGAPVVISGTTTVSQTLTFDAGNCNQFWLALVEISPACTFNATVENSGDVAVPGAVISRPITRYGGDVLGDSITAQSPGCSVLSMYRRGVPLIKNRGVSGNTTVQILARVPDVIADNPRECSLQGGTNDLLGGISPATVFANLYEAWRLMTMAGIIVYVVKPPPTSRAGYIQAVADGNAYLQARFLERGIRVYTPWDQFTDAATGGWISGASPDELHPSWPTRITAGITLAEQIGTANATTYPTPKINAGIVANPLMLTDTAGVATGITTVLPAEATFTCAALTGVLGRVQKFTSASAIRAGGSGLLWTIAATAGGLVPLKRYLCVLKINPKSAPVNMGVDIVATPFNVSTPLTPTPAATRWRVTDDEMYTVAFVVDIPASATLTQLLIRTYPDVPSAVSECAVSVAELQFFEVTA